MRFLRLFVVDICRELYSKHKCHESIFQKIECDYVLFRLKVQSLWKNTRWGPRIFVGNFCLVPYNIDDHARSNPSSSVTCIRMCIISRLVFLGIFSFQWIHGLFLQSISLWIISIDLVVGLLITRVHSYLLLVSCLEFFLVFSTCVMVSDIMDL